MVALVVLNPVLYVKQQLNIGEFNVSSTQPKLRRIFYTSDPYEPSGTIGVYETEEQRQRILAAYLKASMKETKLSEDFYLNQLTEEDFEIGIYQP